MGIPELNMSFGQISHIAMALEVSCLLWYVGSPIVYYAIHTIPMLIISINDTFNPKNGQIACHRWPTMFTNQL